jgi:hypothetical protein
MGKLIVQNSRGSLDSLICGSLVQFCFPFKMTFNQNGWGWADHDDSLCMKELTDPNESSYLRPIVDNGLTFLFKFQCPEDFLDNSVTASIYKIESDYESISSLMVRRHA